MTDYRLNVRIDKELSDRIKYLRSKRIPLSYKVREFVLSLYLKTKSEENQ